MTLSENAEKGRRTAALAAFMCYALAGLSLLTLNLLMAVVDSAVAYYIKRGSLTARNLAVLLRISYIPALAVVSGAFRRYGGGLPVPASAVTVLLAAVALIDISALAVLVFSKNVRIYCREVSAEQGEDGV